ncbi:hypothetical protein N431DRAFT_449656 [Stipitochalara longipes BDJ]|nr:hypothetical protein N431DRAFT_449656 [Stipitochalara longipes BDJ]
MANSLVLRDALVAAEVAGWTSQGCFLDNLAPYQLLPTTNYTSSSLTPDACGTFCTGYKYFGLEDSTTCYCANDLNVAPCNYPGWPSYCGGKPAYPLECTSSCSGAPGYECGNALVLNLYMVGGSIPSSNPQEPPPNNNENSPSPAPGNSVVSTPGGTAVATTSVPASATSIIADPAATPALDAPNGRSTSTIYETDVTSVISCAPTITNCPARSVSASVVSMPVAIVVYSTEWITISSCAAVVTNCPYIVSSKIVPIITINLANNPPSPTLKGSNVVPTPVPTPGNGAVVPGNGTIPGNNTIMFVSGATGNGLVWTSFAAGGLLFLGMCWA